MFLVNSILCMSYKRKVVIIWTNSFDFMLLCVIIMQNHSVLFISVVYSGAQGAAVCPLSYGTRYCERLEWHGAHLAVRVLKGTAADLLRGGTVLYLIYYVFIYYYLFIFYFEILFIFILYIGFYLYIYLQIYLISVLVILVFQPKVIYFS